MLLASISCNLVCREFGERRIDLLLSAPIGHLSWVAGRLTGVAMISVAVTATAALALFNTEGPFGWLAWTGSLNMELLLTGTLAGRDFRWH